MAEVKIAQPGKFIVTKPMQALYAGAMFFGVILFILALYKDATRAWYAYLAAYMYFTNLALGGLFFTALNHVAKAGWMVTIRRLMESFGAFLPFAALGAIVLLFGATHIYDWMKPEIVAHDELIQGKHAYLNISFFTIRLAVFFGGWLIFAWMLMRNSLAQDKDHNEKYTVKNLGLSVKFLLFFAISYSLFAVDALMSVQPHWFSTIWGVYSFAGLFQSTIAMLIIFTVYSMKHGWLKGLVNENHLHDLGKYLKAFTVFYAYIAFSQFMLIWYANLPEETGFYLIRSVNGWMNITVGLFALKFAVPFLLMLPKAAKRNPTHLVMVSSLILIMQYIDIQWMFYPNLDGQIHFSWQEIGTLAMFAGLFLWSVTRFLSHNSLVAVGDPRIEESIHHQVTY